MLNTDITLCYRTANIERNGERASEKWRIPNQEDTKSNCAIGMVVLTSLPLPPIFSILRVTRLSLLEGFSHFWAIPLFGLHTTVWFNLHVVCLPLSFRSLFPRLLTYFVRTLDFVLFILHPPPHPLFTSHSLQLRFSTSILLVYFAPFPDLLIVEHTRNQTICRSIYIFITL